MKLKHWLHLRKRVQPGQLPDNQRRKDEQMDANAKFKIAEFKHEDERVSVYLLNPGDCFELFGGSSRGLVARKTASLVTRSSGPMGSHDVEYDINGENARKIWAWVFDLARKFEQIPLA